MNGFQLLSWPCPELEAQFLGPVRRGELVFVPCALDAMRTIHEGDYSVYGAAGQEVVFGALLSLPIEVVVSSAQLQKPRPSIRFHHKGAPYCDTQQGLDACPCQFVVTNDEWTTGDLFPQFVTDDDRYVYLGYFSRQDDVPCAAARVSRLQSRGHADLGRQDGPGVQARHLP